MSEFSQAFDYVHSTLLSLEDSGAQLRATVDSLQRLSAGGRIASTPSAPKTAPAAAATKVPAAQLSASKVAEASVPVAASVPLPPITHIAPGSGSKAERLAGLSGPVLACTKCPHLVRSRTQVVFGVGNPEAEVMFVGEAPGEEEDEQGEPFVGKAGQLLTKIIETMGLSRATVYIANVLKCRPDMPPGVSGNRKPRPEEMKTCLPYLREQIDIIQPRVIVALGAVALEGLTGESLQVGKVRGKWREFQGIPMMVTYHPAYLLRNQAVSEKRKVWEDMLQVLEHLGKPISEKQRQYFTKA
jgi:DNA polymerase